jgi:hypothetical protein
MLILFTVETEFFGSVRQVKRMLQCLACVVASTRAAIF